MANSAIMDQASVPEGIEWQARHAEEGGAPGTAKVVRATLALLNGETATGRRIANWQGLVVKDALPLRIAGGLHNLVLTGADTRLADVYAGRMTVQSDVDALVCELVQRYDARLLPWLDGPPQTNEAGRSASIMAGLLWLAQRGPARFEMLELGASAGINTMMERYLYRLGGVQVGPSQSVMQIEPEWRGAAPPKLDPEADFAISSIKGCDLNPIDLSDPAAALNLKSYVWPEAAGRIQRIDAAVQLASESAPDVARQDAASFAEEVLSAPQESRTTRVLFHSIVWQYVPEDQQERVTRAMDDASKQASTAAPLAWLTLETNRETFRHELIARLWDGAEHDGTPHLLGTAHPHGAWVEWLG
jgi:hypothetical protein